MRERERERDASNVIAQGQRTKYDPYDSPQCSEQGSNSGSLVSKSDAQTIQTNEPALERERERER